MDIQNDALENTSSLIEDSLNPHKVPLSHSFTLPPPPLFFSVGTFYLLWKAKHYANFFVIFGMSPY